MSFWTVEIIAALSLGFLGSFHCVGMCGPLIWALPFEARSSKGMVKMGIYQAGRISTYMLLGAIAGSIGKGFSFFGWQQWLSIGMGVSMIAAVVFPVLSRKLVPTSGMNLLTLRLKQLFARLLTGNRPGLLFATGGLNGLLPCGLVYFGLAGAVAMGNALEGMAFMGLFGVGTLPALLGVSWMRAFFTVPMRNKVRKAGPYLAVLLGMLLTIRGLGLDIPYVSPAINETKEVILCH